MSKIIRLNEIDDTARRRVGGKSLVLAQMAQAGFLVPETVCVTTDVYNAYLELTGLREKIMLELYRKDMGEMRWEEVWDAATRIRSLLVNTPIPAPLHGDLQAYIETHFKDTPTVVRSSAIDEDSARASFAGLHESIVNVVGTQAIIDAVRRVWASLWSDAAILYRNEIGLDAQKSAMAVIIQAMIAGECSGVAFSRNPNDESQSVIEAVYGLNQGLVDGQIEPDRWILDRRSKKIIAHTPAHRNGCMAPQTGQVVLAPLSEALKAKPPLADAGVAMVMDAAYRLEALFHGPQDVEWTLKGEQLYLLQARPITTTFSDDPMDKRAWYLSLHRSFDNLKTLRKKIEEELIPEMIRVAARLADQSLEVLDNTALAEEIKRRQQINMHWANIYWSEFIPFAHGIRLFGQVYNDTMRPDNPYEFVDLLGQTQMESLTRNRLLEDLAALVRGNAALREQLANRDFPPPGDAFMTQVAGFIERFGDLSCPVTGATSCSQGPEALIKIVLEMAAHAPARLGATVSGKREALRSQFFDCFTSDDRAWAEELLDLARASYQLRDDDNIHLGRIEAQKMAAEQQGQQRIQAAEASEKDSPGIQALCDVLLEAAPADTPPPDTPQPAAQRQRPNGFTLKARQLTGQPAGPGVSQGRARVIIADADLAEFKHGEVLVCDAVDPNMTFVVPLAAGIIERRGGMLIHGAIIAREYGLACVTGVPDATRLIKTGDPLTVDGYLGIVTIG